MYEAKKIAERIKMLSKSKNIVLKTMLDECDLSKNTLSSMLSGGSTPKSENLAKIADYLDCSVDYLLGRTDNPNSHKISIESSQLLSAVQTQIKIAARNGEFKTLTVTDDEKQELVKKIKAMPDVDDLE